MIQNVSGGYRVVSEKGKNLGGPYRTKKEAEKRLEQVEFFKHNKEDLAASDASKTLASSKSTVTPISPTDPIHAFCGHLLSPRRPRCFLPGVLHSTSLESAA